MRRHDFPAPNHLKNTAVITARATQNLRRLNLDFAGLTMRSATVDGTDAHFAREKNELILTPTKTVREGHPFKAAVKYDGTPKMIEDSDGAVEGWIETDDGSTALGEPTLRAKVSGTFPRLILRAWTRSTAVGTLKRNSSSPCARKQQGKICHAGLSMR